MRLSQIVINSIHGMVICKPFRVNKDEDVEVTPEVPFPETEVSE